MAKGDGYAILSVTSVTRYGGGFEGVGDGMTGKNGNFFL